MNFSAPFINRPIATVLLMSGLLLCGLATYRLLPVAALPRRRQGRQHLAAHRMLRRSRPCRTPASWDNNGPKAATRAKRRPNPAPNLGPAGPQ